MQQMKISDIISRKGGTVEELCAYARSKGIDIPNNPDYALSPSQLRVIPYARL